VGWSWWCLEVESDIQKLGVRAQARVFAVFALVGLGKAGRSATPPPLIGKAVIAEHLSKYHGPVHPQPP